MTTYINQILNYFLRSCSFLKRPSNPPMKISENQFWNANVQVSNILYDGERKRPCFPCTNMLMLTLFCVFNILISDIKATQPRIKEAEWKRASIETYWECDFKISRFNCLQFLFINTFTGRVEVFPQRKIPPNMLSWVTFQQSRRAARGKGPRAAQQPPALLNVITKSLDTFNSDYYSHKNINVCQVCIHKIDHHVLFNIIHFSKRITMIVETEICSHFNS